MIKSVFVAVLDWGLGHASRCVPLIRELQNQQVRVVVGGSGPSLQLLKGECTAVSFYELPSYDITYPVDGNLAIAMLIQLPKILKRIKEENEVLDKIIEKEEIDYVLSDNRYGCFSKKVKSVFISHQLNLQLPSGFTFFSGTVNGLHLNRVSKFSEVWIPDEPGPFKYSGDLSESAFSKKRYVGILSRFGSGGGAPSEAFKIVGLVSGPEPQRTHFEKLLRVQLIRFNQKSILIKGKPGTSSKTENGLLTEVDHLNTLELEGIIRNAPIIVSRSGYSTIMDLAVLGKKVIFIPTPGQTEQEYLAEYLSRQGRAVYQKQNSFDIEQAVAALSAIGPLPLTHSNAKLKEAIQALIGE